MTDYKMSYVFLLVYIRKTVPITDLYDHYTLMMYSIGLVIDYFCLVFIGVGKTHLCSTPISYFPYDR